MNYGAESKLSAVRFARSLGEHPLVRAALRIDHDPPCPRKHIASRGADDQRRKHDPAALVAAIDAVEAAGYAFGAITRAARQYGVPRDLLSHYLSARGRGRIPELRRLASEQGAGALTEAQRHRASE